MKRIMQSAVMLALTAVLLGCATAAQQQLGGMSAQTASYCGGGPTTISGGPGEPTTIRCGTTVVQSPAPDQTSLPQAVSTGSEEIRLQRRGGGYLVPVAVNGLPPIPFVLDSGADVVMLPAEVVFTLIRTGTLQKSDFIGNATFVMADGRELPSVRFKIRELRVGRHTIRDVIGSLNPALTDPLLGGSFLSRFASWSIDNQRNALVLSR